MKPVPELFFENTVCIRVRAVRYHCLNTVRKFFPCHHQGTGASHGLSVNDDLCIRVLFQYGLQPQQIVLPVCPAHADKVAFAVPAAAHIRHQDLISSSRILIRNRVHLLFPSCIAVQKQNPVVALTLLVKGHSLQQITIRSCHRQRFAVSSLSPPVCLLQAGHSVLLNIICLDQSFIAVLRDILKRLGLFHLLRDQCQVHHDIGRQYEQNEEYHQCRSQSF